MGTTRALEREDRLNAELGYSDEDVMEIRMSSLTTFVASRSDLQRLVEAEHRRRPPEHPPAQYYADEHDEFH